MEHRNPVVTQVIDCKHCGQSQTHKLDERAGIWFCVRCLYQVLVYKEDGQ